MSKKVKQILHGPKQVQRLSYDKKKWQKTPTVVLLTILNYWPTVLRRMIEPRKGGLTFESVDENPVV